MNADLFYRSAGGRALFQLIQRTGLMKLGAWYLNSPLSRWMIPGYIRRNGIDMTPFSGQSYPTFAAFFARRRSVGAVCQRPEALISPCDGLLSVYPVTGDLSLPMKGSRYRLEDLIPDPQEAARFRDGLCLVFRLQARDYHHFCCFDDAELRFTRYIPGQLHSVQPIACQTVPVYRLNRRWWSKLDTAHFGTVAQITVGAMLVGGVAMEQGPGALRRGQEMGHFTLAGSTILVLLTGEVRHRLRLSPSHAALGGKETPAAMGEEIGVLRDG